jgi:WS/DGAT/MGAT family acyltransferase
MQPLSGLDAALFYLESLQTPLHVGGIYLFDASRQADHFDFQAFRAHMAARLDVARIFRQRLVQVPLNLGHPYWIEDPDFNLDAHLSHRVLAQPADCQALLSLAEAFFSQPLELAKPLWEMIFVEGLDGIEPVPGRCFALLVKAHHAAVDGLSGAEMIWALLDPTPAPVHREVKPWQAEPVPSSLQLLFRTAGKMITLTPVRLAGQLAAGVASTVQERLLHHTPLPPLPLMAPLTCLNRPVTANRTLRAVMLPLQRIQAIRHLLAGTTVNDVVLAICAGALRRYLLAQQDLPEQSLTAAVPIATRSREQWQEMGNRVSVMLVSLATDERDPLQRFQRIHHNVLAARRYYQTFQLEWLTELLPAIVTAPISQLYRRLELTQRLGPAFNLFITNVPGPRQPLYLGGAPLVCHWGMAPVFHGLGIILVITSYLDTLVISVTACRDLMPDPAVFSAYLREAFVELDSLVAER